MRRIKRIPIEDTPGSQSKILQETDKVIREATLNLGVSGNAHLIAATEQRGGEVRFN